MCHYNQQCVNTVGTYRCQAKCGPGFKPSITGTSCEGMPPLNRLHHILYGAINNLCVTVTLCSIFAPGIISRIIDYYRVICVSDVDECQESAVSPCQHQCLNTLGSYRCMCHPGYQLSGHRCIGQSPSYLAFKEVKKC